jgi:Ca-activated chloride channel family protein
MSGAPLDEARAAAKEIVARLGGADRVNVIAFDDRTDVLYSTLQPVTDQTRSAALRFLDSVQSGGGTDIGRALDEALTRQRANAERPIVLLLTDGESDTNAVFAAAQKDHSKARVFTIGLGTGVNKPLLSRLSDMKRGRFTYIQSAEAIRPSVARVFNLVESAVLEAPELSLENAQLLQMQPSTLPDLAPGEELFVTARALGAGPVRVVLKGKGIRGTIERKATVVLGTPSAKPWVGRVWARERVNRLLEDISLHGETDERKTEAIELGVSYGFVTPYTSFLAIPESELTDTTSEMMRDLRAKKQAIIAKRADAVALSRSDMPPGDPVLTVDAPADALRVTAYFPFGERELTYDPETRRWRVRFLVPVETHDGAYEIPVLVIHRDGHVEFLTGKYTIDSREPEFEPMIQCRKGVMEIVVATHEPLREVRAALVMDPSQRVQLHLEGQDPSLTRYVGKLKVPAGARVRIVVADRARNEADEIVTCPTEEKRP